MVSMAERLQLLVTGQVQGVGFRPHVYRLAQQLQLTGWVKNNALGVIIEVQGVLASSFLEKLSLSLPSLARIDAIQTKSVPSLVDEAEFAILDSEVGQAQVQTQTMIAADTSICHACLGELLDPKNRYFRYPFLNCTQCGPRLSITNTLPYDRANTMMRHFPLCSHCLADYSDPANRRYHAQPTACVDCGPQFSKPIMSISKMLLAGKIIALKGLGGYQLLVDAQNEQAVAILRQRKNRPEKPLALMVLNVESARQWVEVDENEQALLESGARPIVLLKKKMALNYIAPKLSDLGIMLPSTPAHYLLFHALAGAPQGTHWLTQPQAIVLIVTSANCAGSPLIIDDDEALRDLSQIADSIISYNRPIATRVDDSVLRVINKKPSIIRRARGFSPTRIQLPYAIPETLGLGGHLKNTFCITRGNEAFVSQHIGSLTNKATIDFFHESLDHWLRFLDVKPQRIACDLHPDFYTTRFAYEFAAQYDLPVRPVQHHHAHIAAVACEHHIGEPALGLALDGYGYGLQGENWGGELVLLDAAHFQRLSHLTPIPQLGGEIAVRQPWRMAAGVLHLLDKDDEINQRFSTQTQANLITQALQSDKLWSMTTSCGRLFDAASALLGVAIVSTYEGQAAMQLESLVTVLEILPNGWTFDEGGLNFLPLMRALLICDPVSGANLFHGTLIAGLFEWVCYWSKKTSIQTILLSGGCFLNKVLAEGLTQQLTANGLNVYLPQQLPPNDGGLALGQVWAV